MARLDEWDPSRGRGGRPYERLKQQVFAEETHCWICGEYVDQTLPPRTPMSRSVDHVVPLDPRFGGHPTARENARLAHYGCNSRRGNGTRGTKSATRPRSRDY